MADWRLACCSKSPMCPPPGATPPLCPFSSSSWSLQPRKSWKTLWVLMSIAFYLALFFALELSLLLSHVILNKWLAFYSVFWISTEVVHLQCCLVATWLMPHETVAVSALSVYTTQQCTMSCHSMQSHKCRVHTCLAVTFQLHFLAEWAGPLMCCCRNMGVEQTLK